MQLQGLFLAWICNNLLNTLVLLLLLNKLPNEMKKPPCLTLVWRCDAQGWCGLGFSWWAGLHIQPFSVCSEGVFPALTSSLSVYWILYFREPFPVWESHCPSGAGSLCQMLGQGNQLFIGNLQSNTCCIQKSPKASLTQSPATVPACREWQRNKLNDSSFVSIGDTWKIYSSSLIFS